MDEDTVMDVDYENIIPAQTAQIDGPSQCLNEPASGQVTPQEFITESTTLVQNKVHVSGLDAYTEENLKNFVTEHYSAAPFKKIEWINDASANLIFGSESLAQEALVALSSVLIEDVSAIPVGEAVDAKPFSQKPEAPLRVRFALLSDKKAPGAAARSRFYLFHPEYDPEERRRRTYREREEPSRRRDGYHRNESEPEIYHASMYDDEENTTCRSSPVNIDDSHRGSHSPSRERRQRNQEKELFDFRNKQNRELFPDRSSRWTRRYERSRSPSRRFHDDDGSLGGSGFGRGNSQTVSYNKTRARDIMGKQKELFPQKLSMPRKNQLDQTEKYAQRLSEFDIAEETTGISIKGKASEEISIKGRASKSAKELFPDKFGDNSGRELFGGRFQGRHKPRRKAVDSFLWDWSWASSSRRFCIN